MYTVYIYTYTYIYIYILYSYTSCIGSHTFTQFWEESRAQPMKSTAPSAISGFQALRAGAWKSVDALGDLGILGVSMAMDNPQ